MTNPRCITSSILLTFLVSGCSAERPIDTSSTPAPLEATCPPARSQGADALCVDEVPSNRNDEILQPADPAEEDVDDEGPREGHYDVRFDGVVYNDCGLLVDSIAPSSVELVRVGDDLFEWLEGAECSLWNDLSYTCDMTVSYREVSPTAELSLSTRALGVVIDPETLEEEQEVRIQCGGPGCDAYAEAMEAQFPCEILVETTPRWTSL